MFYEQGVHVGIDAVCREAGVSKRSLYQLFSSKEELVAASLSEGLATSRSDLLPPEDLSDPRARVLYVFERQELLEVSSGFHGCPFLSVAVEVKSSQHPAAAVVREQKAGLVGFFACEATRAGVEDPELLARQLLMVFDGASSSSVVRAEPLGGLAVLTAAALWDAWARRPPH